MQILKVENLRMYYKTIRGEVKAVDDITFEMDKGDSFGFAGESGCGKTSAALTILKLLPSNAKIHGGSIIFEGKDLLKMKNEEIRREIRWKKISAIFQGAMNALHPAKNIGSQITEAILVHENVDKRQALERAGMLLELVGIEASKINRYPHELSGGMKQRTMIAMSLACNPDLVLADEPTTALDVIVAAQMLRVMKELRQKLKLSMIMITHDLSTIAETCNKVAIMYAGKLVEFGDSRLIFQEPLHPYTQKLIGAFPSIIGPKKELTAIPGFPPNLLNPPPGCRFHPRCPLAMEICRKLNPEVTSPHKEHYVACHLIG